MQVKAIVDSPCQHTLDEIKQLSISLGIDVEGEDADLAEDITSVVRTEIIEALHARGDHLWAGAVPHDDAAVNCQAICADQE